MSYPALGGFDPTGRRYLGDAEVGRITERNVTARYAGETAWLKSLWKSWVLWRGVAFVSSRTGRAAQRLDAIWQDRYGRAAGGVPPVMQMPLEQDVITGFRREAKKCHPDIGGTAEQFRKLVEARDRLLTALGTSAPAPKAPAYAPKCAHIVYRRVRSTLGHNLMLNEPNDK
jgi:hypothetical protein